MADLTPAQAAYFKTLEKLYPTGDMQKTIERAKDDLRYQNSIVRGSTRIVGFQPNKEDTN